MQYTKWIGGQRASERELSSRDMFLRWYQNWEYSRGIERETENERMFLGNCVERKIQSSMIEYERYLQWNAFFAKKGNVAIMGIFLKWKRPNLIPNAMQDWVLFGYGFGIALCMAKFGVSFSFPRRLCDNSPNGPCVQSSKPLLFKFPRGVGV